MTLAERLYLGLADVTLVVHFAFVQNIWFRVAHVAAIGIVAAESLVGFVCPLTTWENQLRLMAGHGEYQGSFMQHWLHQVMFFELSEKAFAVIYVIFFAAVALSFWLVPPRRSRRMESNK